MTVEEIYSNLAAHMIKGLMIHDQMVDYYCFLNLKGYAMCHKYHYISENWDYMKLKKYYIKHHGKLIPEKSIENPKVIPSNWYSHIKADVDVSTVRNGVKTGLEKWVAWETETKELYQKAYKDLIALGAIADANFICGFIEGVDWELVQAESFHLKKKIDDFSISSITGDQEWKYKKYSEKIKSLLECSDE